tara:strand:- start:229 stop:906 length:678 start_codon:yes stop_codon:yes gene_type:complete
MKILIIIVISFLSINSFAFQIPKNNKVVFDVIRKNKIIGSIETSFDKKNNNLTITTNVDIEVKVLFVTAYKFTQISKEIWKNGEFIKIEGHTDFEDEREYFIKGEDLNNQFIAYGMDGKLVLNKDILPLNYWNKDILNEKEVFDTQKGIVRKITVTKHKNEMIEINKTKIEAEKYTLNASSNPKDKGPFPEYTLWYEKNGQLLKFKFINWKDKKEVITQRKNLDL